MFAGGNFGGGREASFRDIIAPSFRDWTGLGQKWIVQSWNAERESERELHVFRSKFVNENRRNVQEERRGRGRRRTSSRRPRLIHPHTSWENTASSRAAFWLSTGAAERSEPLVDAGGPCMLPHEHKPSVIKVIKERNCRVERSQLTKSQRELILSETDRRRRIAP